MKEVEEIDAISEESRATQLLVRDKQLFYGCSDGMLIVKQYKK